MSSSSNGSSSFLWHSFFQGDSWCTINLNFFYCWNVAVGIESNFSGIFHLHWQYALLVRLSLVLSHSFFLSSSLSLSLDLSHTHTCLYTHTQLTWAPAHSHSQFHPQKCTACKHWCTFLKKFAQAGGWIWDLFYFHSFSLVIAAP